MKKIKIHFRIMAIFFSSLIFFQGCTVYKSANVTLDEAVRADMKARIKTNDNRTLEFKRIRFENGQYYGVHNISRDIIKTQINEQKVERVQLKDKITSIILPVGMVLVSAVVIIWGGASGFD